MGVIPIPGLEHLPFAEVWFHDVDAVRLGEASAKARALGKTGLEVWTTTRTPAVTVFLEERGYDEVRRYAISELDVAAAPDPPEPRFALTTFAERPELADRLFELARVAYADQPGRSEAVIGEAWYQWGLGAHPADAYFIALDDGELLGYGYLELDDAQWKHGFTAVARPARGRGVAGAIKRAQIAWAKEHGVETLQTANETRLDSMLSLNRRLGYRPLYEGIVLRGPLAQAPGI
jgi:GNAT superfamily N-acetyltransferase